MENPAEQNTDTDSPESDSQNHDCPFLEKQDTIKEKNPSDGDSPLEEQKDTAVEDLSEAMQRADLAYGALGQGARPKEHKKTPSEFPREGDEDSPIGGEDEEDVMASSVVCTDGSDVEALTDDRDLSDIEMCDSGRDAGDSDEAHSSWDSGLDKAASDKVYSDSDAGLPSSPVLPPVNAVAKVQGNASTERSDSPSSLPLEGGAMGQSPPGGEDEVTPVAQGYDFMLDLDNLANGGILRPDSLMLPRPLQHRYRQKLARSESESSSWSDIYSHHSSTEALLEAATNTPLHSQGTVLKEGDQIAFVAEDLNEKIKRSSPLTKAELDERWLHCRTPSSRSISSINSMSSSASGWSNSSASGWSALSHTSGMSRSSSVMTQSPEEIPPVDPRAVAELELHAYRVGANLMHMLTTLKTNLHKMSALTGACVETYKESIDNTCDSVDGAIKSMYALMAKCEELSKTMRPVHQLADQIMEIKRVLDLFEGQVARDEQVEENLQT